ncbi:hypothetical protein JL722_2706 [Aureococcus anophagefferens]|nr:hypothetical protein JL722_2706 [Aureococcus anophagefferens]
MLAAWGSMIAAVVEEEDYEGLLAKPFADAGVDDEGTRVPKMQHRLTAELDKLADVKTIGFAKTRDDRSAARRGGTLPCDERAGIVDREYRLHAEKLDKLHPDEASPAPFERRLGSFGSVVGFVAGYFGELSKGAAHEVPTRKILLYLFYCPYLPFATSD